ncbi:VOC family protein [Shimia sp. R11_0]|uniref:VOC family protein n=1 Tax=Shimia sp. R11_0 TaxID=2821096 RepID=UPI001ADA98BD|nr:VOC family protein [Shimia sp. R11_0]MBO9478834.1 VOC family protein [Shimia sp. R11_0]
MALAALTNIITLSISVSDRHASAAWFEEKLGFTLRYHLDDAGWSELNTKTDGVILGMGEQIEPQPGNCVPVFGVEDIDTARQALEAADVRFDGPTQEIPEMVKLATFYDPDNNAFMLAQDLSTS